MAGCSWPRAVGRLLPAAAPGTWAGPGAGVTHWRKGPWEGIPWECWAGHPSLEAHSVVGSQSEGRGTFPRFMAPGWILCWLCSVREAAAPTFPLPLLPGRAQLLHPRLFHFFISPILTLVFPSKLQRIPKGSAIPQTFPTGCSCFPHTSLPLPVLSRAFPGFYLFVRSQPRCFGQDQ